MKRYKLLHCYVDGAYSTNYPDRYSGAFVIINPETGVVLKTNSGCGTRAIRMRNVAGELSATMRGTQLGLAYAEKIIVFYDYQGIEDWITGAWRCKKAETRAYFNFMFKYINPVNRIQFVKVKAHSGDKYNELADELAKEALKQNKEW